LLDWFYDAVSGRILIVIRSTPELKWTNARYVYFKNADPRLSWYNNLWKKRIVLFELDAPLHIQPKKTFWQMELTRHVSPVVFLFTC